MAVGLTAAVQPVTSTPARADDPTVGEYLPLWAAPLLETATGIGTPGNAVQKIAAGGTMTFQALGQGGLPTSGVGAISVNVHAVNPGANGHLSIYPSDKPTTISTVAFTTGESTSGADITQITATGQVTVANNSTAPLDVLVAVNGYYKSGGAATTVYKPLTTAVLWDTRSQYATGTPLQTMPMAAWSSINIQVAGQVGIPGQCDQSAAIALNIVALEQTNDGELKVEPTDSPIGVGTLRFTQNDWNNSTFSIVQMSCTGQLRVTNSSPGTVNVSISVRGYFTYWDETQTGSRYKPVDTTTVVDTATGLGRPGGSTAKLGAESHLVFDTTGPSGVPANTVSAAAMQIRISGTTAPGWITLRPEDQAEIPVSSLVYQTGEDIINFDIQKVSGLGRVAITNHGTGAVHVQISVRGFYIHQTVEVIEDDMPEPSEQPYKEAIGTQVAEEKAAMDPDSELGTISYDPVTNTVITTATTATGLSEAAAPIEVPASQPDIGVGDGSLMPTAIGDDEVVEDLPETDPQPVQMTTITPRAVLAPNPSQSLDSIVDEISELDSTELPGGDLIQNIFIQSDTNRVVVEAASAPTEMVAALDARYGASKIAVHVTPDLEAEFLGCSSSWAGTRGCVGGTSGYPLVGGAEVTSSFQNQICTSGYIFKANGLRYLLTAGHCGITAAVFTTPGYASNQNFGYVEKTNFGPYGSFPSWSALGPNPGKSQNTGDLSFVRIYSGSQNASSPVILGGSCCSISPLPPRWKVKASWSNYKPKYGDRVCFSGARSGTQCGWTVEANWVKKKIEGKWLIGAVRTVRDGRLPCPGHGDSGAPVFTVLKGSSQADAAKNGVEAAGILSAGVHRDKDNKCVMWYSTIQNARRLMGSTSGYNDVVLAQ